MTEIAAPSLSGHGRIPNWALRSLFATIVVAAVALARVTGTNVVLLAITGIVVAGVAVYAWSRSVEGRRRAADRFATFAATSAFALALIPLASLLVTVVRKGSDRFDGEFFAYSLRNIVGEGGGALHAILGTVIITGLAAAVSVPIGILCAVYLREYGRGMLATAVTFFVDVMTGIPSIVAGLFAYAVFAIFLGPGIRLGVIGAVALSVLMIPIVVRSTEEMLRIVPDGLREASYALGVSKWRTVVKVVLPTALAGIVTGVMLAIARVVGETAPLLVTTGVISSINANPFSGRMMNLSVFAYYQYKTPGVPPEPYFARAWAAALTLILIVLVLYFAARLVSRRYGTEMRR